MSLPYYSLAPSGGQSDEPEANSESSLSRTAPHYSEVHRVRCSFPPRQRGKRTLRIAWKFTHPRRDRESLLSPCVRRWMADTIARVTTEISNESNGRHWDRPSGSERKLPLPEAVPIDHLRQALRLRIAETSFRIATREVGMSASGLHTFLAGTSPHYSTVRKVTAWYVREAHRTGDPTSLEALRAAMGILTQHLPASVQPVVVQEIVEIIRVASARCDTPPPPWLDLLHLASRP